MLYNIRKYLVCNKLTVTFAYVKFKNKKVMTKFIDRTERSKKITVFKEYIDYNSRCLKPSMSQPKDWTNVEFIGTHALGDVFKCWDVDRNSFALVFGTKGDEFDNEYYENI